MYGEPRVLFFQLFASLYGILVHVKAMQTSRRTQRFQDLWNVLFRTCRLQIRRSNVEHPTHQQLAIAGVPLLLTRAMCCGYCYRNVPPAELMTVFL